MPTFSSLLSTGRRYGALLLLGLCSCASSRNELTGDPFAGDPLAVEPTTETINAHIESTDEAQENVNAAIHLEAAQLVTPAPWSNGPRPPSGVVLTSGEGGAEYFSTMGRPPVFLSPAGPIVTDPDPEASPVKYPDEYLYDGGDRADPVHITAFQIQGLDPEDTVADYSDGSGVRHVKKSTRTAVYSPRFAAVSVISTLGEGIAVHRAGGSMTTQRGVGFRGRTASIDQNLPVGTERVRTRSRASGVGSESWATAVDRPLVAADHATTLNLFEDYSFLITGTLERSEMAGISAGVQAAATWSHEQYPVIVASTAVANEVYARFAPEEIAGLNDPARRPGQLRIVKLADTQTAQRGEVITFTIRYDNIGDRPAHDVVILDNLTTRLVYIAQSETSDHKEKFTTEDNGVGSLILRWELDESLAGGEGGVVTFQARVE